ncbi:MAG: pantetheine-phosphate adenylyltransferase [bacterium]
MTRRVIYPGSFDPITNGHIDVVKRALSLFDEVIIAVAPNREKNPLFTKEERVALVKETVAGLADEKKLRVVEFDGLLVRFAVEQKACAVVRGLRAVSDFEFEFQLALTNRKLEPKIETIFLMPKENYVYLSSHIVKEIVSLNGNIGCFVPSCVETALRKKFFPA